MIHWELKTFDEGESVTKAELGAGERKKVHRARPTPLFWGMLTRHDYVLA